MGGLSQSPHSAGEEPAQILLELAQDAVNRNSGDEALAQASATSCYTVAELRKDNELMCKGAFAKAKAHMRLGDFDQAATDLSEADNLASSNTRFGP
jgi:tetratricopeptide (TPR) repeat protein